MNFKRLSRLFSPFIGLVMMGFVAWFGYTYWSELIGLPSVLLVMMALILSFGHVLLAYDVAAMVQSVKVIYGKRERSIAEIERAVKVFVSATLSEFMGGQLWCLVLFMNMMSAGVENTGVTDSGVLSIGITSGFSFLLAVVMNSGVRRGRRMVFEINARKSGAEDVKFTDRGNQTVVVTGCLGAYLLGVFMIVVAGVLGNALYNATAELQVNNLSENSVHLQVERLRSDLPVGEKDLVYIDQPPVIAGYGDKRLYIRMISDDITGLVVYQTDEDGNTLREIPLPLEKTDVEDGSYFNFVVDKNGVLTLSAKGNFATHDPPHKNVKTVTQQEK